MGLASQRLWPVLERDAITMGDKMHDNGLMVDVHGCTRLICLQWPSCDTDLWLGLGCTFCLKTRALCIACSCNRIRLLGRFWLIGREEHRTSLAAAAAIAAPYVVSCDSPVVEWGVAEEVDGGGAEVDLCPRPCQLRGLCWCVTSSRWVTECMVRV
jgi:hypothetical protein